MGFLNGELEYAKEGQKLEFYMEELKGRKSSFKSPNNNRYDRNYNQNRRNQNQNQDQPEEGERKCCAMYVLLPMLT